jgi:hypothetical protein
VKVTSRERKIRRFTGPQKTWEATEATTTTPKVVSAVIHLEVRQLNWKWAVCRREDPTRLFLLALGLTRVKEEPDTDVKIILHTSRQPPPGRPTPQYVRRGIQAYVEELLFLFGFGMVMTFLCVLLYIYIEVFCVTPTQPSPPIDFILPYTE